MNDLISKTALLKHLNMAVECEDCPRNADKELYECVHNPTPQRCTCSEIAQICIRITDFEVSTDVQPVKRGKWCPPLMGQGKFATYCSMCQYTVMRNAAGIFEETPFCPHCGADMRGDTD